MHVCLFKYAHVSTWRHTFDMICLYFLPGRSRLLWKQFGSPIQGAHWMFQDRVCGPRRESNAENSRSHASYPRVLWINAKRLRAMEWAGLWGSAPRFSFHVEPLQSKIDRPPWLSYSVTSSYMCLQWIALVKVLMNDLFMIIKFLKYTAYFQWRPFCLMTSLCEIHTT